MEITNCTQAVATEILERFFTDKPTILDSVKDENENFYITGITNPNKYTFEYKMVKSKLTSNYIIKDIILYINNIQYNMLYKYPDILLQSILEATINYIEKNKIKTKIKNKLNYD